MSSRFVGLLPTFFYYLVVIAFISGCSGSIQSTPAANSPPPQPPKPPTASPDPTPRTTSFPPKPRVIRNDVTTAENLDAQKKALEIMDQRAHLNSSHA